MNKKFPETASLIIGWSNLIEPNCKLKRNNHSMIIYKTFIFHVDQKSMVTTTSAQNQHWTLWKKIFLNYFSLKLTIWKQTWLECSLDGPLPNVCFFLFCFVLFFVEWKSKMVNTTGERFTIGPYRNCFIFS